MVDAGWGSSLGVSPVGLEMDPGNWQFSGLKPSVSCTLFWINIDPEASILENKHRPWGGFWVYPVTYLIILSSCEFRIPNHMGLHGLSEKWPAEFEFLSLILSTNHLCCRQYPIKNLQTYHITLAWNACHWSDACWWYTNNQTIMVSGWWFEPLWKIWKSLGMIIPNIWEK